MLLELHVLHERILRPLNVHYRIIQMRLKESIGTSTAMKGNEIEEILSSANTVLNYVEQRLGRQVGTRPKRPREVDNSDTSGSGYRP